jgi:hypothetical protein
MTTSRAFPRETRVDQYGYDEPGYDEPRGARVRRPRRRGRGWLTLAVVLVVLLGLAVIGDRIAAAYAEREIRAQLVSELAGRDVGYATLDVAVNGVPFLDQVARGRYDGITIDLTDVQLANEGREAVLPSLHVVASGVEADTREVIDGTADVIADEVTGTGVVTYSTLENLVDYSRYNLSDVAFTDSGDGLRVTGTASLGNFEIPMAATAKVSVVDGQFRVQLSDAEAVGVRAPPQVRQFLSNLVENSVRARLPELPFSLTLDNVDATPEGLKITATAQDVELVS